MNMTEFSVKRPLRVQEPSTAERHSHTQILDQGITTFQNNKNMNDRESFGAIGVLTSAADTIKQAKDAKIIR